MEVEMNSFEGYLFSKLANIDTRAEGPVYFLQQFDEKELHVIKQANLWQEDRKLHPFLNKKVKIEGEMSPEGIAYTSISAWQ
jgi:hypothetical protein